MSKTTAKILELNEYINRLKAEGFSDDEVVKYAKIGYPSEGDLIDIMIPNNGILIHKPEVK